MKRSHNIAHYGIQHHSKPSYSPVMTHRSRPSVQCSIHSPSTLRCSAPCDRFTSRLYVNVELYQKRIRKPVTGHACDVVVCAFWSVIQIKRVLNNCTISESKWDKTTTSTQVHTQIIWGTSFLSLQLVIRDLVTQSKIFKIIKALNGRIQN